MRSLPKKSRIFKLICSWIKLSNWKRAKSSKSFDTSMNECQLQSPERLIILPSKRWRGFDAQTSSRSKSAETCRKVVPWSGCSRCWAAACELVVCVHHRLMVVRRRRFNYQLKSISDNSPVPFRMQSNFAIHDVSTVSLLSPSISGSDLTLFSMLLRNTSRKSCWEQAPLATIFCTRSDFRNTSWYDWTAFWKASSAIICVSPFMNAWKRFVMVSRFCFVTFCCRLVISFGCLLLNGYEMHRETNT